MLTNVHCPIAIQKNLNLEKVQEFQLKQSSNALTGLRDDLRGLS